MSHSQVFPSVRKDWLNIDTLSRDSVFFGNEVKALLQHTEVIHHHARREMQSLRS